MDIKKIEKDLKTTLSPNRYKHSLLVAKKAKELAKIYHIDENKAYLTGLIHDIAKELSEEENKKWITIGNLSNDLEKKERFVSLLNDKIVNNLSKYPNILINKTKYSIPHILNISIMNVMPEVMINALDKYEVYLSTNTACSSGEVSHSVMAIYDDLKRAKHTLRISLSHVTTTDEINKFLNIFSEVYDSLKIVK